MALTLFMMLAFPLFSQETPDSLYLFRFFFGKNEFYAPGMNNGAELERLYNSVEQYKDRILNHELTLKVDGYCASRDTKAERQRIAKIRSNRVKSELITNKGLREDCFLTHNHPEQGDFVTIHFINTKDNTPFIPETLLPEAAPQPEAKVVEEEVVVEPPVEHVAEIIEEVPAPVEKEEPIVEPEESTPVQPPVEILPEVIEDSPWAVKTNLLAYLWLMPNIEVEWKFAERWSVALEWQGAWWAKLSDPRRVYRLSTVIPEVRYWVINRSRWHGMYIGAFVGGGLYDLSNSKRGHKGEGGLAGVSAGYMWPIGKHLSMDAEIGLGYMGARDKLYKPYEGHFLYQLTKNINYFGPLRLKLSLVWRIPK